MSSFNVNTASAGAVKPWGGYFYLHFDERSPASRGADVCQWECARVGSQVRWLQSPGTMCCPTYHSAVKGK